MGRPLPDDRPACLLPVLPAFQEAIDKLGETESQCWRARERARLLCQMCEWLREQLGAAARGEEFQQWDPHWDELWAQLFPEDAAQEEAGQAEPGQAEGAAAAGQEQPEGRAATAGAAAGGLGGDEQEEEVEEEEAAAGHSPGPALGSPTSAAGDCYREQPGAGAAVQPGAGTAGAQALQQQVAELQEQLADRDAALEALGAALQQQQDEHELALACKDSELAAAMEQLADMQAQAEGQAAAAAANAGDYGELQLELQAASDQLADSKRREAALAAHLQRLLKGAPAPAAAAPVAPAAAAPVAPQQEPDALGKLQVQLLAARKQLSEAEEGREAEAALRVAAEEEVGRLKADVVRLMQQQGQLDGLLLLVPQ
jgi:hypothetical protein